MTVDVEDYFHVSVFDEVVPRERWPSMESRVVANTERLLDLFDGVRGPRHVLRSRLGGGAIRARWCGPLRRADTKWRRMDTATRLVYTQTPEAFREDVRRAKGLLEDASGTPVLGYRAPSFSVTRRSLWALDVLLGRGVPLRRQHLPDSPRPLRHSRRAPVAALHGDGRRADFRGARIHGSARRRQPPGGRRRLLSHPPLRLDSMGYRARQRRSSGSP